MVEDARRAWIEVSYEDGCEIPLPRNAAEYSGRFVVRVPRDLHRQLVRSADDQGVSLNQYVVCLLSSRSGQDQLLRRLDAIERKIREGGSPPQTETTQETEDTPLSPSC